jgi:hypothetical protein
MSASEWARLALENWREDRRLGYAVPSAFTRIALRFWRQALKGESRA